MRFEFGQFKPGDAQNWNGKIVNLVTRDGDKTGDDATEYKGLRFCYESGKHHALLAEPGTGEPVAGVFLEQVADIQDAA
ncbi:hypothetical protein [Planotetraspora sp. GP83]|uniref:hypothetical protein n=1 Tax=Planotetraspora sp. GP83 TaxID=3156264 RepID=UPI003516A77C